MLQHWLLTFLSNGTAAFTGAFVACYCVNRLDREGKRHGRRPR